MNGLISLVIVIVGIGVLGVAWTGFINGELPAGSKGFRAFRPNRCDNPISFHFFFTLYVCGGIGLIIYGLMSMFGIAAPIRIN